MAGKSSLRTGVPNPVSACLRSWTIESLPDWKGFRWRTGRRRYGGRIEFVFLQAVSLREHSNYSRRQEYYQQEGKTVKDNEFNRLMKQPDEISGAETQPAYVVVPDADAHYARAKAAGAEILIDIKDEGYGGRGYACRDLEGHIWYFGTYNPWQL